MCSTVYLCVFLSGVRVVVVVGRSVSVVRCFAMASFLLASTAALVFVFLLISSSFSWTYVHGQGGEEGEDRLIDTLAVEPSEALGRVWSLSHAQTHDRLVASASGRGGVMIFAK